MYIPFCDKHTQTNIISLQSSLPLAPDLPDRLNFYTNLDRLIIRNEMLASCFALQSCRGFNKTHRLVPLAEPCPPGPVTSLCKKESVALVKEHHGKFLLLLASMWPVEVCVSWSCHTSVIMGNPRMKKETQQTRVKSGLCFLKYLGNSSDTEVTMVSMVANWSWDKHGGRKKEGKSHLLEIYLIKIFWQFWFSQNSTNFIRFSSIKTFPKDLADVWLQAQSGKCVPRDSDWLSPAKNE